MRVYLLVIYILLLVTTSVTANQPIVFADSPYPPYVLGSLTDKEPQGGTAIDLVNQLFADLPEYQVSFRLFPWKRALLELEKGSVDGVTMIAKTPEREEYLDFTAPLLEYELALFYASSAFPEGFEWTQLSDLRDYRIGVVDGYAIGLEGRRSHCGSNEGG